MTKEQKKYSRIVDYRNNPQRFLKKIHYAGVLTRIRDEYNVELSAIDDTCLKFNVTSNLKSYSSQKKSIDSFINRAEEFMDDFWQDEN